MIDSFWCILGTRNREFETGVQLEKQDWEKSMPYDKFQETKKKDVHKASQVSDLLVMNDGDEDGHGSI